MVELSPTSGRTFVGSVTRELPPSPTNTTPAKPIAQPNIAEFINKNRRGTSRTPSTMRTAPAAITEATSGPYITAAAICAVAENESEIPRIRTNIDSKTIARPTIGATAASVGEKSAPWTTRATATLSQTVTLTAATYMRSDLLM